MDAKQIHRTVRTASVVAALAALAAPAAGAGDLPPIDAGSNIPNPVYTQKLPPIDAGSALPNPVYAPKLPPIDAGSAIVNPAYQLRGTKVVFVRPKTPAAATERAAAGTVSSRSGFPWTWAVIGAGLTSALATAAAFLARRRRVLTHPAH
jgi:hypothetical protein